MTTSANRLDIRRERRDDVPMTTTTRTHTSWADAVTECVALGFKPVRLPFRHTDDGMIGQVQSAETIPGTMGHARYLAWITDGTPAS